MILIFSTTTPLGIGIGWYLSNFSDIITAVFFSISSGTFIYIAASEIIVEEFSISKNKWEKLFLYTLAICKFYF